MCWLVIFSNPFVLNCTVCKRILFKHATRNKEILELQICMVGEPKKKHVHIKKTSGKKKVTVTA